MASKSEVTFGARLSRAKQLSTHLGTFISYTPVTPDCSVTDYNTLINAIEANNTLHATSYSDFSLAVENRQKLFSKNPDSLLKIMVPIGSYVKAKFGKTSKQATDIVSLINKIRGEQTGKLKKDELGEFVSQSERSYGSMTQNFSNIKDTLASFGADYTPTTAIIKIVSLTAKLTDLLAANQAVALAYGILKPAKETRGFQFADLKDRSNRIKNSVKSQYGVTSVEYKLIKGLQI